MSELRPCPFCGSEDVYACDMPNFKAVTCKKCCSVSQADTWNRRATDQQMRHLLEELDRSVLDSERLDFVIKTNLPLQRSAEGIYVKDIGFFATGREAIDAAMQKDKEMKDERGH